MTASPPLRDLLACGQTLPDAVRDTVLARGSDAVPELLALLLDEPLSEVGSHGDGWVPVHAAHLLCRLRDPRAIPALLRTLRRTHWETVLHNRVVVDLPEFGAALLEPAWQLLQETANPDARVALRSVLARLGVRDERLLATFLAEFDADPTLGALNLRAYGDPAALPVLDAAFDRFAATVGKGPLADLELMEMAESFQALGGVLSPERVARLEQTREVRSAAREREKAAEARPPSLPRNALCPCGSGRKVKRCHGAR